MPRRRCGTTALLPATGSRYWRTTAGNTRCWRSPPPAPRWCWCRSTSCSPPRRSPTSSGHSHVRVSSSNATSSPSPQQAMAHGGDVTTQGRDHRRRASTHPPGWDDFAQWLTTTTPAPDLDDRRRPAGAADVHQRHRVPAEGRDALQPQPDVATTSAPSSPASMCGRRRRNPLDAAVPLRAAGQLPGHRHLPRCHQHHPARAPNPRRYCAASSATRSTNYFAPPTVWIGLLRSPDVRRG